MPNQYKNKIIYGGQTLIDLTGDTVSEETVIEGFTFHKANGAVATGTAKAGGSLLVDIIFSQTEPVVTKRTVWINTDIAYSGNVVISSLAPANPSVGDLWIVLTQLNSPAIEFYEHFYADIYTAYVWTGTEWTYYDTRYWNGTQWLGAYANKFMAYREDTTGKLDPRLGLDFTINYGGSLRASASYIIVPGPSGSRSTGRTNLPIYLDNSNSIIRALYSKSSTRSGATLLVGLDTRPGITAAGSNYPTGCQYKATVAAAETSGSYLNFTLPSDFVPGFYYLYLQNSNTNTSYSIQVNVRSLEIS